MSSSENPFAAPLPGTLPQAVRPKGEWFTVTPLKMVVMAICTFNFYMVYWHYKQWSAVKAGGGDVLPWPRAIFQFFFTHSLGREIEARSAAKFASAVPATAYVVMLVFERIVSRVDVGPLGFIGLFSSMMLIPFQKEINAQVRADNPTADLNGTFSAVNILGCLIGASVLLYGVIGTFLPEA
jgi:hypothetical protein